MGQNQLLQVLHPPEGGGIGEAGRAVLLQGDPLHLPEAPAEGLSLRILPVVIKPGIAIRCLRPQEGGREAQSPRRCPLPKDLVGGLGVQIDQERAAGPGLLHGNQVVFCLARGVAALFQPDWHPGNQQLPAPAGVLYMADLYTAFHLYMGNKSVGPGQENP